jgi:hypothetical protein
VAHNVLGMALLESGRTGDAIAELEHAVRIDGSPRMLTTLGYAYGTANRRADARAVETRLKTLARSRYVSPFSLALVSAGLGEDDRAFSLLERAYEERSDNMAILRVYPLLARLRRDRRFSELMARVDAHTAPTHEPAPEGERRGLPPRPGAGALPRYGQPESRTGVSLSLQEYSPMLPPAWNVALSPARRTAPAVSSKAPSGKM